MNITLNNHAKIEAKYYVYVLEAQERQHHKPVAADAKNEVWKRMTMILADEKKKGKKDQDQRIEKLEKKNDELTKTGRKEEIYDMGIWMKNVKNANLGIQDTEVCDNPQWLAMKQINDLI